MALALAAAAADFLHHSNSARIIDSCWDIANSQFDQSWWIPRSPAILDNHRNRITTSHNVTALTVDMPLPASPLNSSLYWMLLCSQVRYTVYCVFEGAGVYPAILQSITTSGGKRSTLWDTSTLNTCSNRCLSNISPLLNTSTKKQWSRWNSRTYNKCKGCRVLNQDKPGSLLFRFFFYKLNCESSQRHIWD